MKKVPVVLQIEAAECGAACLAMILAYHGKYVGLDTLREQCNVSRDGSKLSYVLEIARSYGLKTAAYRSGSSLKDMPLPCVVHWKFNHFVVVEKIKKDTVIICDPAHGRMKLPFSTFEKGYSGVCATFEVTENFETGGAKFHLLKELISIVSGERKPQVYLACVMVMLSILGLAIPGLTRSFTDFYLPGAGSVEAGGFYLLFLAILVLQCLLLVLQTITLKKFEYSLSACTASRVLTHALHLPVMYFMRRSRSALVQKLADTDTLSAFIAVQLVPILFSILFAVVYMTLMFFYNALLTVVVLLLTCIILFLMQLFVRKSGECAQRSVIEQQTFFSVMVQNIILFETTKSMANEDNAFDNIVSSYVKFENAQQQSAINAGYISSFGTAIPLLFQVTVLCMGGLLVVANEFTVGMLLAYQSLTLSFFSPILSLIGQFSQMQSLGANVKNTKDILTQAPDKTMEREESGVQNIEKLRGDVCVENLTFSYNKMAQPTLKEIYFNVKPGGSLAIVGSSGSGKSTLINIMLGLYELGQGSVLFDGYAHATLSRQTLANSVAVASQTPSIISGTVRDNITWYNSAFSQADVVLAAKEADIHEDILKMSKGYDTLLVNGGGNISGGQRQRIVLARTLLRRPTVLVLDEATSALDSLSEKRIMDNIAKRGCTKIVVAHRLSTIRDCDEILVLEKGEIVQRGTHEELMGIEGGAYQTLIASEDSFDE